MKNDEILLLLNCKNLRDLFKEAWQKNLFVSKSPSSKFENAIIRTVKEDFFVIEIPGDGIKNLVNEIRIIPINGDFEIKIKK